MAEHDDRGVRRLLFEMTHGCQALAVGQKEVGNDQIEGALLYGAQPIEQRIDADPFDFSLEALLQRGNDLFRRMLFGSDQKNRVFTHWLVYQLTLSVHTGDQDSHETSAPSNQKLTHP